MFANCSPGVPRHGQSAYPIRLVYLLWRFLKLTEVYCNGV